MSLTFIVLLPRLRYSYYISHYSLQYVAINTYILVVVDLCMKGVFINPALVEPFGLTLIEVRRL